MSDFETAHQLEQAKASKQKIPPELAFEAMIKNQTSPVSQFRSPPSTIYLSSFKRRGC
jgi:hypothetical protein